MLEMTRQELYDLVWTEAVDKVAQRFYLSGNGLRKICLKYDIPVPPRGYWARVAAGQKVKRIPLPSTSTSNQRVFLPKRTQRPKQPEAMPDGESVLQQRDFEANPKNRIEVRPEARRVHPWAKGLRKQLSYSGRGHWRAADAGVLTPIIVSASSGVVDRVVQIVDALGRAADRRDAVPVEVTLTRGYGTSTEVHLRFHDATFRLYLSERTRRIRRDPESDPPEPILPYGFATPTPTYWFEPTGELRLSITGTVTMVTDWSNQYPITKEAIIKDKAGRPLEQQLHDVFITMAAVAAFLHEDKRQREERRRLEAQERARQAELARQRELEAQRLKELEGLADRHARAVRLRQFIEAVGRSGSVPGPVGAPENLQEWLAWAQAYANRLDPVPPDSD